MPTPPLSPETQRRLALLFHGDDAENAADVLLRECGNNLPFCEKFDSFQMERIRFAALKLSAGNVDALIEAIDLAQTDWRDLLMAAGFGHDIHAHKKWLPQQQTP